MKKQILTLFLCCITGCLLAQHSKVEGYLFTDTKVIQHTPIKNQDMSNTCWSFSGLSFLESEMIRNGHEAEELSVMWVVRHTYLEKAIKFVRLHGTASFTPGAASQDIFNTIKKYGVVPEEIYHGLNYGTTTHRHSELDAALKAYITVIARDPNKGLSTAWLDGFNGILDAYFGKAPEKFTYKGVEYTPQSYATSLGLNLDDYLSFTSFTHHPAYTHFALELEDNWSWGTTFNLPLNEFTSLIDSAIDNGYTIYWVADVTERGCATTRGFAVVPEISLANVDQDKKEEWLKMNPTEQSMYISNRMKSGKEVDITPELRQNAFDKFSTTDDHGMHIIGKGVDQTGKEYYKIKNSWGSISAYDGYFYASKAYVAYKTINIVMHKNAVPSSIIKRMK